MTNILVTGSSGFIGRNLVPKLLLLGYNVIPVCSSNGDIAEESTWKQFPSSEVVIHLAAKSFVPDSWINSYEYMKCNLMGTIAALNYCKRNHAKLIFISSYLFGNPDELPINESAPLRPTNPYALSKKLAEDACSFYSENQGLDITIIRPFNIYGPGQSENYLIQSVISQIRNSQTIHVKDLEPRRDYVFIDDVVNAILKAIELKSSFNIFNIGSGISYSVSDIIQMLQVIVNTNLPVHSGNERRKGEIMDTVADIRKAEEILGWKPTINIRTGLRLIVENS